MMKIITHEQLKLRGGNSYDEYLKWVDYVINHQHNFSIPTKTRIALNNNDYFNVMPCAMLEEGIMGTKNVSRSQYRRDNSKNTIDSQILLYDSSTCECIAVLDGNYITSARSAAIAVYSLMNFSLNTDTIAMIGFGNIGTMIGDIYFHIDQNRHRVKLFQYKDQAERFAERYKDFDNLAFEYCDTYDSLIEDSDVVISSVTYAKEDFCHPDKFKKGCTVIPVHMRGFKGCDQIFEHIITSDLESIKKFEYYEQFRKCSLVNDVVLHPEMIRDKPDDRIIIYNLGIAAFDIYFAYQLFKRTDVGNDVFLSPGKKFYM